MTIERGYVLTQDLANHDAKYAPRMLAALSEPFALSYLEAKRRATLLNIAATMDLPTQEAILTKWFEPHHPWSEIFLAKRVEVYEASGNPLLAEAQADLKLFRSSARASVEEMMGEAGENEKGGAGAVATGVAADGKAESSATTPVAPPAATPVTATATTPVTTPATAVPATAAPAATVEPTAAEEKKSP